MKLGFLVCLGLIAREMQILKNTRLALESWNLCNAEHDCLRL